MQQCDCTETWTCDPQTDALESDTEHDTQFTFDGQNHWEYNQAALSNLVLVPLGTHELLRVMRASPAQSDVVSGESHTAQKREDKPLIEFDGFDEFSKKVDELKESAESIQGTQLPLGELLTPGFLAKHTRFLSVDEMFEASGFKVETADDFEKIPDEEWTNFIEQNTPFATWSDMLSAAAAEWARKRLGFDEE